MRIPECLTYPGADAVIFPRLPSILKRISSRLCLSSDADRLNIRKLSQAMAAEFAAITGMLDTAKGQTRIGSHHFVNEHNAGFDFVDKALLFGTIICPDACS